MRPLPEILGYHLDWPDGCANYKVWWKNGQKQPLIWRIEADEMLDWLKDNGRFISLVHVSGMDHVVVEVRHKPKQPGHWWDQTVRGHTIREALELACRACDEFDTEQASA